MRATRAYSLAMGLLLVACGADDRLGSPVDSESPSDDRGGGAGGGDAGPMAESPADAGADAPTADPGLPATEATPGFRDDDELGGAPSPDGTANYDACYGAADGEEPEGWRACDLDTSALCASLRSCCVGDGTCCSATGLDGWPGVLPLDECAASDAAACLEDAGITAEGFGEPLPRITGGALYPNGDDLYDSGLILGSPVDLTSHRTTVSTTFAAADDCGATCLEGVGIAFTTQAVMGSQTHVRPLVGLVLDGRGDVSLWVGDEVLDRWAMGGAEERWTLALRPTGELVVHRGADDVLVRRAPFAPADEARLVVYGRNRNPPASGPDGARVTALRMDLALCDMPSAWAERDALSLSAGGGSWTPAALAAPAVAYDSEGGALVAFEHEGGIHLARRTAGSAPHELALVTAPGDPLQLGEPGSARDPAPVWNGDGWHLYYTLDDSAGAPSIAVARLDAAAAEVRLLGRVLEPELHLVDAVEQPTVVRHHTGEWVMAARLRAETETELALFRSADGLSWDRYPATDVGAHTRRATVSAVTLGGKDIDTMAFDADEVSDPSLIIHDGAWQLFYAARRGTRWRIGLLLSDELRRWRPVGSVAEGSGEGFDRVGVRAPGAASREGAIELFYAGDDGTRTVLGRAWRPAADFGTRD